jgi:hypothetical protein
MMTTKKKPPRQVTTVITSRRALLSALLGLAGALLCLPVPSAAKPLAPPPAKDEKPYALIFGTVWTADNHAAYGVKVRIRRADQEKAKWEAVSDHNGEFAQRVPAGKADYILQADVKTKGKKPETKVHVDNDERVDVSLHLTE